MFGLKHWVETMSREIWEKEIATDGIKVLYEKKRSENSFINFSSFHESCRIS